MTLLLNYAHPLTPEQLNQVTTRLGEAPTVRTITTQVDRQRALGDVARDLTDAAGLAPDAWQTLPLVVNPPGLAPLALALLAEIHGRCGYFPPILNLRPVPDSVPPRYEVAEVVNLQNLRDAARQRR
jgi:hypothetical protein